MQQTATPEWHLHYDNLSIILNIILRYSMLWQIVLLTGQAECCAGNDSLERWECLLSDWTQLLAVKYSQNPGLANISWCLFGFNHHCNHHNHDGAHVCDLCVFVRCGFKQISQVQKFSWITGVVCWWCILHTWILLLFCEGQMPEEVKLWELAVY